MDIDNDILGIEETEIQEVPQTLEQVDYTELLVEMNTRLENLSIILTDIYNFSHDILIVLVVVVVGSFSVLALWKEGLKW